VPNPCISSLLFFPQFDTVADLPNTQLKGIANSLLPKAHPKLIKLLVALKAGIDFGMPK
jgi:hypothetical protein